MTQATEKRVYLEDGAEIELRGTVGVILSAQTHGGYLVNSDEATEAFFVTEDENGNLIEFPVHTTFDSGAPSIYYYLPSEGYTL